jgi:hypothetical protein
MTLIDDATGRTLARFGAEETTWAAAGLLKAWIAAHGVPRALYVDAKNLYVRPPTNNEHARGVKPLTQFGRMCATLGIELIVAASPQAKGRVERIHGTNQDRLIKKMRRLEIATVEAANAYLDATYLAAHNTRFAARAASAVDYHQALDPRVAAADVWSLEAVRVLGNDWVVRYGNRGMHVVAKGAARRYCAPGTRLVVRETEDGAVRVLVRTVTGEEHVLAWEPVSVPIAPRALVAPAPTAVHVEPAIAAPPTPAGRKPPSEAQLAARAKWSAELKAQRARHMRLQAFNERRRAEKAAARQRAELTPRH